MNSKTDKIEFLKAIAAGEISPGEMTTNPIIVSDGKEVFRGLMIEITSRKKGKHSSVVLVGEARDLMEKIKENVKSLRAKQ